MKSPALHALRVWGIFLFLEYSFLCGTLSFLLSYHHALLCYIFWQVNSPITSLLTSSILIDSTFATLAILRHASSSMVGFLPLLLSSIPASPCSFHRCISLYIVDLSIWRNSASSSGTLLIRRYIAGGVLPLSRLSLSYTAFLFLLVVGAV